MPHHDWMDFGFIELYFLYPPVCGVLLYRSRPKMAKNHLTKRFKTTIRQKVFESCTNSFFDDTDGLKLFRNILIPCSDGFSLKYLQNIHLKVEEIFHKNEQNNIFLRNHLIPSRRYGGRSENLGVE